MSTTDAGQELAERRHEAAHDSGHPRARHDRILHVTEAVMLSLVALVAAWSGYCAAAWDTRSSDLLTESSETTVSARAATEEGLQIQTLDAVAFDDVFAAYVAHDRPGYRLAIRRLRPEYRVAVTAWLAQRPLVNSNAPADPSLLPQYHVPEQAQGRALTRKAHLSFATARKAGDNSDKYVRITVILATVLFLIGISGHFPVRAARYALIGIGSVLITYSLVSLLGLPGPPG